MGDGGVVTVCIPAYEAGEFIDRTLRCAREQTHEALRILVSIDVSDDNTEAICRRHADDDERIEVLAQPERLGWAGNVNSLLDHADSEFAFLYFHDDVIEPTYCERLVGALRERPEAASAHSDLGRVGDDDRHLWWRLCRPRRRAAPRLPHRQEHAVAAAQRDAHGASR